MFLPRVQKKTPAPGTVGAKTSPAVLRVQKDLSSMTLFDSCKLSHSNGPDDLLNFHLAVTPSDGNYRGGKFNFSIAVPETYPYDPPKVRCLDKIYHPNIDLNGAVCLNILREEWKPVLSLEAVITGISYLFDEQNADDPLNQEAATVYRTNLRQFKQSVRVAMSGGTINSQTYSCVLPDCASR